MRTSEKELILEHNRGSSDHESMLFISKRRSSKTRSVIEVSISKEQNFDKKAALITDINCTKVLRNLDVEETWISFKSKELNMQAKQMGKADLPINISRRILEMNREPTMKRENRTDWYRKLLCGHKECRDKGITVKTQRS